MGETDKANAATTAQAVARLLHDLRGPLVNAKSFHAEMIEAVSAIQALLPDDDVQLTKKDVAELRELLSQDLVPCLEFATQSVDQFQTTVTRYERDGIL